MAVAPTEKIRFSDAGPAGPERFEAGVDGYESRSFRGLGVFTSTPFEVSDDTDALQLLQRSTQVGEFYRMAPPNVWGDALPSHYMDIVIYDEEHDKHVHITLLEALNNTGINEVIAARADKPDLFGIGTDDLATWQRENPGAVANMRKSDGGDINVVALLKTGLFAAPSQDGEDPAVFTPAEKINRRVAAGRWLPIEVVIARPFIEHLMMSAVMTVAGRDTGATLFGPADMRAAPPRHATPRPRPPPSPGLSPGRGHS